MREIKFRAWHEGNKGFEHYTIKDIWKNGWDVLFAIDGNTDRLEKIEKTSFVLNAKWQQSTGLKDKNGVEIFEGDCIRYYGSFSFDEALENYNDFKKTHPALELHKNDYDKPVKFTPSFGIIKYSDGCFYIDETKIGTEERIGSSRSVDFYGPEGQEFSWEDIEVIGNIYENPELLEEK